MEILKMDKSLLEDLFRNHFAELSRYAFTFLKDQDGAEDMVQQLFFNLWNKREELEISGNVRSYLFRAVHNLSLNQLKSKNHRAVHQSWENVEIVEEQDASQPLLTQEMETAIGQAMRLLPEKCAEIFRMSRSENLKYQEIADRLQLSVKTVENQMGKALRILREALQEYLPLFIILFICEL
jgi:RNA polymerase sigma-70 factor (family 1)